MGTATPEDLHREFVLAFNAGDVEAVLRLYETDASLVPQPGQVTTGYAANRQALEQFIALKGRMTITTSFVVRSSDLALLRGEWHLAAKDAEGRPIELKGRNVEIARRQADGGWLFAIDHPFGAD
jgi:uncharacterized protein (TIGR02246 family)